MYVRLPYANAHDDGPVRGRAKNRRVVMLLSLQQQHHYRRDPQLGFHPLGQSFFFKACISDSEVVKSTTSEQFPAFFMDQWPHLHTSCSLHRMDICVQELLKLKPVPGNLWGDLIAKTAISAAYRHRTNNSCTSQQHATTLSILINTFGLSFILCHIIHSAMQYSANLNLSTCSFFQILSFQVEDGHKRTWNNIF